MTTQRVGHDSLCRVGHDSLESSGVTKSWTQLSTHLHFPDDCLGTLVQNHSN